MEKQPGSDIFSSSGTLRPGAGGIELWAADTRLTAGAGFHSYFLLQAPPGNNHREFSSDRGRIVFSSTAQAQIDWDRCPCRQTWTLNPAVWGANWELRHEFLEDAWLRELKFGLILSPRYGIWEAEGNRPAPFPVRQEWEDLFRAPAGWIGAAENETQKLPVVRLHLDPVHTAGLVQNTGPLPGGRILQGVFAPAVPRLFRKGETLVFNIPVQTGNTPPPGQTAAAPCPLPAAEKFPAFTAGEAMVCCKGNANLEIGFGPAQTVCGLQARLKLAPPEGPLELTTDDVSFARGTQNGKAGLSLFFHWDTPRFWKHPTSVALVLHVTAEGKNLRLRAEVLKPSEWELLEGVLELRLPHPFCCWRGTFEEGEFPPALCYYELPFPYRENRLEVSGPAAEGKTVFLGLQSRKKFFPVIGAGKPETAERLFGLRVEPDKGGEAFLPAVGLIDAVLEPRLRPAPGPGLAAAPPAPACAARGAVYVLDTDAEKHDRVLREKFFTASGAAHPFAETASRLPQAADIVVGVHRYNFFRAAQTASLALKSCGRPQDLRDYAPELFPVDELQQNFQSYLLRLERALRQVRGPRVVLEVVDAELFDILAAAAAAARENNPRDVLRCLGVVCESALVGPRVIVFDPLHACNANCLHCWVHTPGVSHPPEFYKARLEKDVFLPIIDEAARLKTDGVIFQGDGEPLMHPDFWDMVRAARERDLNVLFFTNGYLLDKKVAQTAVDLGVEEIYCSLPAGDEATFARVNPKLAAADPGAFRRIVENCRNLVELRERAGRRKPALTMTHVLHSLNHDNLMDMAQNAVHIGADRFRFYLIRLDDNNRFLQLSPEQAEALACRVKEVKSFLGARADGPQLVDNIDFQLGQYEASDGSWARDSFLRQGCLIGWFFNLVPARMDMSFCCHLRTVGHLDRERYADVWNSARYDRWRTQAKRMEQNRDALFLNGAKLFDHHCAQCDNHQMLLDIRRLLDRYGLARYCFPENG